MCECGILKVKIRVELVWSREATKLSLQMKCGPFLATSGFLPPNLRGHEMLSDGRNCLTQTKCASVHKIAQTLSMSRMTNTETKDTREWVR